VAHYRPDMNAMTRPIMVREDDAPYGRDQDRGRTMHETIVQTESIGRFHNYSYIREAMLPWLLSGEIRIKDVEMLIGRLA